MAPHPRRRRIVRAAVGSTVIVGAAINAGPSDLPADEVCAVETPAPAPLPPLQRAEAACIAMQDGWSAGAGLYRPDGPWPLRLIGQRSGDWSTGQAAQARIDLAATEPDPARRAMLVAAALRGVDAFWTGDAYAGAENVVIGPHGAPFYDDNHWIGLALLDAYAATGDPRYLRRAEQVMAFIDGGWDRSATDADPGGTFWKVGGTTRNTVSTAGGAQLALRLFRITGEQHYLASGTRMVAWVARTLRNADGLYWDNVDASGRIDERAYSYNQGLMLGDHLLLYQVTGDAAELSTAQEIARASLEHFGATGWSSQPVIFNAIFFRNLMRLDAVSPDARYRAALDAYADSLWATRGHDGATIPATGDETALLAQAGAVQIFALQGAPAPPLRVTSAPPGLPPMTIELPGG